MDLFLVAMVVFTLVFLVSVKLILVSDVISIGSDVIVHDSSFVHVQFVLKRMKWQSESLKQSYQVAQGRKCAGKGKKFNEFKKVHVLRITSYPCFLNTMYYRFFLYCSFDAF